MRGKKLTIRYLAPTPVGVALRMKATLGRVEGRKTWGKLVITQ